MSSLNLPFVMKNLSAIPRLSLFAAFTILITIVVYLAGFTVAEVNSNFKRKNEIRPESEYYLRKHTPLKENFPYFQGKSEMRGDELSQQTHFDNYYKDFPREKSPFMKHMKRHSEDFGDSEEFDNERETDGYGYDDDEYYHFNYKRDDDANGNIQTGKVDNEGVGESNKKEEFNKQNIMSGKNPTQKDDARETETIEMINFKETHPNIDNNPVPNTNPKPFASESAQKKTVSSDSIGALKMSDLKGNSAIDEKLKDRKEESSVVHSSADSKITEIKKGSKATEDKESMKLKDADEGEVKEKKEKEVSLKDSKLSISGKSLKEVAKNTEEKEKISHNIKSNKLSESSKLKDVDKFGGKGKEAAKIAKEDKDSSKLTDKMNPEDLDSNAISQFNNRASFVSNDYKDNIDTLKTPGVEEDEKNSEENDVEKTVGLNDYQDDYKEQRESLKKDEGIRNYDVMDSLDDSDDVSQDEGKMNDYFTLPIALEIRNENPDLYKKRESWKEHTKSQREQEQQQQDQQQQQQQVNFESPMKGQFNLNFPASDLENTDYHKNYIKSLRRYKGLDESPKVLNPEPSNYDEIKKANSYEKLKKRKRSKMKKRRVMNSDGRRRGLNENRNLNGHTNVRRNVYRTTFAREHYPNVFQLLDLKTVAKKYAKQQRDLRKSRNSPQKLEYEIKIINHNQPDSKNSPLSNLNRKRRKKDVRFKVADHTEDKYLKKYPYSQVSRDDLTRFNEGSKQFKRSAPFWNEELFDDVSNKESHVKTRGVPSGYYSNRVKFGQKHYTRNDYSQTGEPSSLKSKNVFSTYDNNQESSKNRFNNPVDTPQMTIGGGKNLYQQSWDPKNEAYKHDPIKRYDDNGFMNNDGFSNSLLLVKKDRNGDRVTKTFVDANTKGSEDDLDPDQIAKILSKDNDYLVLKRTDKNKFQKISDSENSRYDSENPILLSKKSEVAELEKQDNMKSASKQTSIENRGVYTRSSHKEDDNKKLNGKVHGSESKSNLKKTFEKFRDLADFFRDSEQEVPETQHPSQDSKEGSDIVFSEDKLPDPIIINNEVNSKTSDLKPKTQNSISSISTNFKQLDQGRKSESPKDNESGKNMFVSEVKTDSADSSWDPALKNAFPEAKSINSISKNGNEIIVLDFNGNQLKTEHLNRVMPSKQTQGSPKQFQLGSGGATSNSLSIPGDRQVEVVLNDDPTSAMAQSNGNKMTNLDKKYPNEKSSYFLNNSPEEVIVFTGDSNQPQITIPMNQLAQLSNIFKIITEKKMNGITHDHFKGISKKNTNWYPANEISPNVNQFLRDFRELSEMNKDGYGKRGKFMDKRFLNEVTLPSSSFPELSTYSNANLKYLGSLLQNIMTNENVGIKGSKEIPYDEAPQEYFKTIDSEYQKSDRLYPINAEFDSDPLLKHQGQWMSAEERRRDYLPFEEDQTPDEVREKIINLLQSEGMKPAIRGDYQNEIRDELSAASDRVQRLRREGISKRKLRKTIEDALTLRERRQSEKNKKSNLIPESNSVKKATSKAENTNLKTKAASEKIESVNKLKSVTEDSKNKRNNDQPSSSELKENKNSKTSSESESALKKSDLKNHLSKVSENPNANQNEKTQLTNINENKENNRKRRQLSNQKVSTTRDVKNKVSKTEVQSTILKNLVEDNDESLYFPGMRRKLLWTEDNTDAADSYSNADNREFERQTNCVKNAFNKCIDPMILEIFGGEKDGNKNRARRSAFHSNFKREIDLDESMPNDFQNFLVTSLGGFEGQKREVVKKDEALWEGKETSQDNYNQIAENLSGGKDTGEDSALEKREAPTNENHKRGSYKDASNYFEAGSDTDNTKISEMADPLGRPLKKARSQEKAVVKGKESEFDEEKIPTHIRIQITNASSKEKKSSKPIMDDSETSSNELDTVPKEKEFFEKNKLNSMRISNPQKLHQIPKSKYSYAMDFGEGENTDNSGRQKLYVVARNFRRGRRKKKKYVQENPMKPVKDFIAFDQKAMETLIRKYIADQNLWGATTQKMPVSNHLPQVETVYNPTQGTNKAQLDAYRSNKVNPLNTKSAATVKNSLQANDATAFDENILRSYLKEKGVKIKGDKSMSKEVDDVEWKPSEGKSRVRQDSGRDNQIGVNMRNYKNYGSDSSSNTHMGTPINSRVFNPFGQMKWYQPPYNNYFYRTPTSTMPGSNSVYDSMKMKQDIQNWNGYSKDHSNSKTWPKQSYLPDTTLFKQDDKERISNSYSSRTSDPSWNAYDYFIKKPYLQKYKARDYLSSSLKSQADNRNKIAFTPSKYKFFKNMDEDKPSIFETLHLYASPSHILDTTKDTEYLDTIDDEYMDDDSSKQELQFDDPLVTGCALKKGGKTFDTIGYHHLLNFKNTDLDDPIGEDDDDTDEDYDETTEDDDLDDYSLLATGNAVEPEIIRNNHGNEKLQGSFHTTDSFHTYSNTLYPKTNQFELRGNSFEHAQFKDTKNDDKFEPGTQQITLTDLKTDVDPFGGTLNALKKANENSNIFGKNLIKNLNKYSYDDTWKDGYKLMDEKSYETPLSTDYLNGRLNKRKMDWQKLKKNPDFQGQIGSRLFYAAKTEMYDTKNTPNEHDPQERKSRNVYYRLPKRNPLNAELRGMENEFEYEFEGNGKHFIGNILNGKPNFLDGDEKTDRDLREDQDNEGNTIKRDSEENENSENVEDVRENLEDSGETISEDNVLENVIGKYIMRKSVKPSSDPTLKKTSEELKKDSNSDPELTQTHKIRKKSLDDELYENFNPSVKVIKKRLCAGHLAENNFKKYHKKNLNKKRQVKDIKTHAYSDVIMDNFKEKSIRKERESDLSKADEKLIKENEKNVRRSSKNLKRSALDIFKKITNKDKDTKKAENVDARTAGFEPLLSSNDKKYQIFGRENEEETVKNHEKQYLNKKEVDSFGSNLRIPNEDDTVSEKKKEKSKEEFKDHSMLRVDKPWRIELNKKYDVKIADRMPSRNSFNSPVKEVNSKGAYSKGENSELKAFLVISKNVRAANPNSGTLEIVPPNEASQREVGSSYRRKRDVGADNAENRVWKRSLEFSADRLQSNDGDASGTQVLTKDTQISMQKENRALHDTKSPSEGGSKAEAPHLIQRNSENASFVNTEAQLLNSGEKFSSKEKSKKRKSIFPPPSDANIIGDSRHLNEERSKYLGQQIVDAIIAHVSSNPRFNEIIGPGLASRTPISEEDDKDNKRTLHQTEFSDQVQSLLHKVMFDLEKLAEKHVKRRMCNRIDKQSKKFLQSLLSVSAEDYKSNKKLEDSMCSTSNLDPGLKEKEEKIPSSVFPGSSSPVAIVPQPTTATPEGYLHVLENLKKKRCLLLRLINDYQHLSELEKETLDVNFQHLVQQLHETNRALGIDSDCSSPESILCQECKNRTVNQTQNIKSDFESFGKMKLNNILKSPALCKDCCDSPTPTTHNPSTLPPSTPPKRPMQSLNFEPYMTSDPPTTQKLTSLPQSYYYEAAEGVKTPSALSSTNSPNDELFEKVSKANFTDLLEKEEVLNVTDKKSSSQATDSETVKPKEFELVKPQVTVEVPESFDLLPRQNPSKVPESTPKNSERVRIKQSLPKETDFQNGEEESLSQYGYDKAFGSYKQSELNKLGIGDAAGIALSTKYRGPWVSNLDLGKGVINSRKPVGTKVTRGVNHKNINDQFSKATENTSEESESLKSSRSLPESNIKQSRISKRDSRFETQAYYEGPAWPLSIDRKFYARKTEPIQTLWAIEQGQHNIPVQYFFRRHNFTNSKLPDDKNCNCGGNSCKKTKPCCRLKACGRSKCGRTKPCGQTKPCPTPEPCVDPCPKPEPEPQPEPEPEPCSIPDPCSTPKPCPIPQCCPFPRPCPKLNLCQRPKPLPCPTPNPCPIPEHNRLPDPCPIPEHNRLPDPCPIPERNRLPDPCPIPERNRLPDPCPFPEHNRLPDPCPIPERIRLPDPCPIPERNRLPDPCPIPERIRLPDPFPIPERKRLPDPFPLPERNRLPDLIPFPDRKRLPDPFPIPERKRLPDPFPIPERKRLPDPCPIPERNRLPDIIPIPERNRLPDPCPIPERNRLPDIIPIPGRNRLPDPCPTPESTSLPDCDSMADPCPLPLPYPMPNAYPPTDLSQRKNLRGTIFLKKRKKRLRHSERWRQKHPKAKHKPVIANSEKDKKLEEDSAQEFLSWSSMPAVHRRFNNLGMGLESKNDRQKV